MFLLLVQTMNLGAKVLMALPPELLLIISRVPVSLNGIIHQQHDYIKLQIQKGHAISVVNFALQYYIFHRRTVVSIPNGPSALAVKEAAWGLARYAAISQVMIYSK